MRARRSLLRSTIERRRGRRVPGPAGPADQAGSVGPAGPLDPPVIGPSAGPPPLRPGRWVLPGSPSAPSPRDVRRDSHSRILAIHRFIVPSDLHPALEGPAVTRVAGRTFQIGTTRASIPAAPARRACIR
jgi:hypothetical protein